MGAGEYPKSLEHRRKLSIAMKGRKFPSRKRPGKFSEAHRAALAASLPRGDEHWTRVCGMSLEHRKKLSDAHKGHKHSEEWRKKMSTIMMGRKTPWNTGENNRNWRGGITATTEKARKSGKYLRWRRAVLERDGNKCVKCGADGVRLDADHIKGFADYPELRFEINNGRSLCRPCHMQTGNYGGYRIRKGI